jgi:hypothetical protein
MVSGQSMSAEAASAGLSSLSRVVAAEYFVGTDPGEGAGTQISAEDGTFDSDVEGNLQVDLDMSGLAPGEHLVGIRYKDDAGAWSPVSWLDLVVNAPAGATSGGLGSLSQVVAAEYFVDNDPGAGAGTALNPEDGTFDSDVEGNLELNLDMSGLAAGEHRVGIRYKDEAEAWSPVSWLDLVVSGENLTPESTRTGSVFLSRLVTAEYFVDNDPGEGAGTPMNPEDGAFDSDVEGNLEVNLDVSGFAAGEHKVGIRYKDDAGVWSPVRWLNFLVVDEPVNFPPTDIHLSGATVAENQATGTYVGQFTATDPDANATHSFTLVAGTGSTHNSLFTIDANGNLKTAAILDHEANATLSIRVQAKDDQDATLEKVFSISVTDIAENIGPVITSYDGNATVEMNVAEGVTYAAEVNATDADGDALTYSIHDGADVSKFDLNPNTGVLTFKVPPGFENPSDADVNNTYEVTIAVSDGTISAMQSFTLTVVDATAPVITLIGVVNVTHEAGVAYVDSGATWTDTSDGNGTVVATGAVNPNLPGVYVLTYDFADAAGNVAATVTRTVTVVDTTAPVITLIGDANIRHEEGVAYVDLGAIWTDTFDANGTLAANGAVNVNAPGVYILTYDFTDAAGNAALTVRRTVTVTDAPNIFIDVTLSGTKVTEQRPAGGIVGQFHATDFAQGATHAFALVEGNGSQHNHLFTIDANGMLKTAAILDYEVNATLNIRVRGTAARNVSLDKAFSISVIDVEEKPANASWHKELDRVALGGGWYSSNWLGTFWDGGSGWIYHWEHGWLYPLDDGAGNYWLYHANLGWLWTGSSLYGQADGRRFLYSISLYSWLYFDKQAKNFYVYEDSRRIDHRGDRIARLKVSSSDDEMGLVSGGGYRKVGATVNLTAVPEEGYKFVEWRSSQRGVMGTIASLQLEVIEAEEIRGSFEKKTDEEILGGVLD